MSSEAQILNLMTWEDIAGHTLFGKDILLIFTNPGSGWQTRIKGQILSIIVSGGPYPHLKTVEIRTGEMSIWNHRRQEWKPYREEKTRLAFNINHSEVGTGLRYMEFSAEENNLFPGRKLNGQIAIK